MDILEWIIEKLCTVGKAHGYGYGVLKMFELCQAVTTFLLVCTICCHQDLHAITIHRIFSPATH